MGPTRCYHFIETGVELVRTDYFNGLFDDLRAGTLLPLLPPANATGNTGNAERNKRKTMSYGIRYQRYHCYQKKPDNTGNETATRKNTAYHFRLHNGGGGGTYITTAGDLEAARRELLKRYGDRLALVALA